VQMVRVSARAKGGENIAHSAVAMVMRCKIKVQLPNSPPPLAEFCLQNRRRLQSHTKGAELHF
jgi:hypothetical protein